MIVSCPACSTRYLLDATALAGGGRPVRCAKCGHTWVQTPPEDLPKRIELVAPTGEARPVPPGSNLPMVIEPAPRRTRTAMWGLFLVILLALLAGAVLGRNVVVAHWPPASKLYALAGLPVEALGEGLEIRIVNSARRTENGVQVLIVEGEIANLSNRARDVPTLRAALTDGSQQEVGRPWTFSASEARLLPGQTTMFITRRVDPPSGASSIAVTFTTGS
jgi:predicted Zn finger-like uncharacterized protein